MNKLKFKIKIKQMFCKHKWKFDHVDFLQSTVKLWIHDWYVCEKCNKYKCESN